MTKPLMPNLITHLRKLRGRSVAELRTRGAQEVAKLEERILRLRTREMSDRDLCRVLGGDPGRGLAHCVEPVAARLCAFSRSEQYRSGYTFFESLCSRGQIVCLIEQRFPKERAAILDYAHRVTRGRVDLLAAGEFILGDRIDWHLEPLSGKRTKLSHWSAIDYLDPSVAGDKKVTWELNRHGHFITLGQAYYLTGDRRFAASFVSQASSWMDANPPNQGINWASSLEVAVRSIAWLWSLHLLAGASELTEAFLARLLKHLYEHGSHVERYLSHHFSPNTHLTGEALGLFYLGVALPEFDRARMWQEKGLAVLAEQLPVQVRKDGVYFEQSTYYHRYTADFYLHLMLLARSSGIDLPGHIAATCEQMLEYLMWITRPDGSSPLIGDDDAGRLVMLAQRPTNDFRDTLAIGAAVFGRSDWKSIAGEAPVEVLWLLGPNGLESYDRVTEQTPALQSRAFVESGNFVMRDGWSGSSAYALITCGPHGALSGGHAHSNALAFEFGAMGKPWLIDPGTYTYTGSSKARNRFRVTEAHNTVTVDGEPQSVPDGPFSWSSVATGIARDFVGGNSIDYFTGSHDGYQRLRDPVTHTRTVLMVKSRPDIDGSDRLGSYLVVRDTFVTRGNHSYAIAYHLAPGCLAGVDGSQVLAVDPEGRRLCLHVFGRTTPSARIAECRVSKGYLHYVRSSTVIFEFTAEGPADVVTFLIPHGPGRAVQIEERSRGPAPAYGFYVTSEEVRDVLLLSDGKMSNRYGPLAASGVVAWSRFVDGEITRAILIDGRKVETKDGASLRCLETIRSSWIEREQDGVEVLVGASSEIDRDRVRGNITVGSRRVELGHQTSAHRAEIGNTSS